MKPELRLVTADRARGVELRDPVELYLATLSATGRRTMRAKLRTIQRLLGVEKIDPQDLPMLTFAARAALQDAHAAPATINATLSALKGVARAAWQTGLITADQLSKIRDIRSARGSRLPRGRLLSESEVEAVVFACTRDCSPVAARDAAIIALTHNLGLRRAECSSLDVGDYNSQSQTMLVHGKGDKERVGYLVDKGASQALADWLEYRKLTPGPLLCPVTRDGKVIVRRLSDQAIYDALRKRGLDAGVPNFTPHNLRRTFATSLLDQGADISVVQKLMGHSRLDTTTIYDRRGEPTQRRATALLRLPYQSQRQPELPFGDTRRETEK